MITICNFKFRRKNIRFPIHKQMTPHIELVKTKGTPKKIKYNLDDGSTKLSSYFYEHIAIFIRIL